MTGNAAGLRGNAGETPAPGPTVMVPLGWRGPEPGSTGVPAE